MLLFALGFIDFVSSILLFLSLTKTALIIGIGSIFGIVLVFKGIYSILTKSYFGALVDMLAATFLFLAFKAIYIHYVIVAVVGLLLFIKSMQSMIPEILG